MSRLHTYYRRCHICGGLTETGDEEHVHHCQVCGKAFAKFQYFDDRYSPTASDAHLRPLFAAGEYEPVKGLTAHWTN